MKLLFCKKCQDVFKIDYEIKTCKCGETKGRYLNNINAEYFGIFAVPLGFENRSFKTAIANQPELGPGERFDAFIIEKECPTFIRC